MCEKLQTSMGAGDAPGPAWTQERSRACRMHMEMATKISQENLDQGFQPTLREETDKHGNPANNKVLTAFGMAVKEKLLALGYSKAEDSITRGRFRFRYLQQVV